MSRAILQFCRWRYAPLIVYGWFFTIALAMTMTEHSLMALSAFLIGTLSGVALCLFDFIRHAERIGPNDLRR